MYFFPRQWTTAKIVLTHWNPSMALTGNVYYTRNTVLICPHWNFTCFVQWKKLRNERDVIGTTLSTFRCKSGETSRWKIFFWRHKKAFRSLADVYNWSKGFLWEVEIKIHNIKVIGLFIGGRGTKPKALKNVWKDQI